MHCPFCAEEIRDEAVVCRHCRRDLTVVKPVLDRLKGLEDRLAALEASKSELAAKLDGIEAGGGNRSTQAEDSADGESVAPSASQAETDKSSFGLGGLLAAILIPVMALIATHWMVVMVLDMKFWVIRTLSLVLPLLFGLLFPVWRKPGAIAPLLAGMVVGGLAVSGMMTVTGLIDDQPIWPQDKREWREVVEYGISMWLSYATGGLLGSALRARRKGASQDGAVRRLARDLAKMTAPENESRQQLEKRIQALSGTIATVVPVVTGAVSIISGLRKLWE